MWLTVSPLTAASRAARCLSSSGPGSMIATSPWPTMKLDVPLKVNGPGLSASTRRMRGETVIVVSGGISKERSKRSETIDPKDEVVTETGPLYSPGRTSGDQIKRAQMTTPTTTLASRVWQVSESWKKQALLAVLGSLFIAICAQINIPL